MISSYFERGRLARVLRASRSLLDGAGETQLPPREPYVQGVTASSAVICWMSERPDVGVVEYGKTPELGRKEADARVGRRHAVALADLDPGSTYHYRVEGVGGSSSRGSFRTASVGEDSSFNFAVIGDSGSGGKGQLAVAKLLGRLGPDLILHTGDVVYPAGEERHYDRRFFAPYRHLIKTLPLFPVLGNHDVRKGNGAAFLENFHPPPRQPAHHEALLLLRLGRRPLRRPRQRALYYGDRGGTPEEHKAFLEEDLAATRKHEKVRQDLEPIFARHKVDLLVFSGHDHAYERTVPIRGATYVVSGGGGRRLYRAGKSKRTAFSKSAHHTVVGPTHRRRTPVAGGRRSWRHGYRPLGPLAAIRQMTAWRRVSLQPLARSVGPSTQK